METRRIPLGYWSDPFCIWAYVAEEKLDRVLDHHSGRVEVVHHVIPVFGSIPARFREGPWASAGGAGRAEASRRIAKEQRGVEISGQVWLEDPPSSSWAAGAAAKAVSAIEARGEAAPGAGGRYLRGLRDWFFERNVNTARRVHQLALAEALEIPRGPLEAALDDGTALALLWEDQAERERLRLQGSPTYVFDGGRALLYGNFDYAILDATIRELERGLDTGGSHH
jgi:predicted DsbA family dithiol-disulfide isomerase